MDYFYAVFLSSFNVDFSGLVTSGEGPIKTSSKVFAVPLGITGKIVLFYCGTHLVFHITILLLHVFARRGSSPSRDLKKAVSSSLAIPGPYILVLLFNSNNC